MLSSKLKNSICKPDCHQNLEQHKIKCSGVFIRRRGERARVRKIIKIPMHFVQVGQNVHSSFSVRCYRKTRANFLANPIPSLSLIYDYKIIHAHRRRWEIEEHIKKKTIVTLTP